MDVFKVGDVMTDLLYDMLMLLRYLDDRQMTAEAHNKRGFYKTGDIGRREGKYFWIMGRASVDSM